ncbi:MAG: MerR family transcriptional regulator [Bacteroidetes bacterium]|nr:MerR family transcriptional regulator [Bacteroidota bacterium]MCL5026688.1 MerR family transcriptional regulator [Chloroflexota bacterium]
MTRLRIGELAATVGMRAKTIRYYEQIGLVPKAQRDSSGYRVYPESEIARLRFIKRSKLLWLSLKEIKEIAAYVADGHCCTAQTKLMSLIGEKIDEIDARTAELAALRADLQRYRGELESRAQEGEESVGRKGMADCSCLGGMAAKTAGQAETTP